MRKKTINIISIISLIGLLNIFYLNATNFNNFAKPEVYTNTIPSVQEHQALLAEMQKKYRPGDQISDSDFHKNAQLSGQKVERFEKVYRLDTRSPDVIIKSGFRPNPNTASGVGTAWDHYRSTTGNFVSTAAAFQLDNSVNHTPEFNKLWASHYYGIEKPIGFYAEQYKGSSTPPPPKNFKSYLYEIEDIEGIREPRNYSNISNPNKSVNLSNNEVLTRGVDPSKVTGVRVATNITVESWTLAKDWFGQPMPGVWVPDKVSGDPYSVNEYLNKYKDSIKNPLPMTSLSNFRESNISVTENGTDKLEKIRPSTEVELTRDQFKKAIGAGKGELTEVVEKLLPEKPGTVTGNLDSATVSSGQDFMKNANRSATITATATVLASIGSVSDQLKKTKDINKQNQIINEAATSANHMVIGAGLFAAGIVGAKYLAVVTLGTAAGTVIVPVLTVTMLPIAFEHLTDAKVLSNMANAILDPKSSVYTSAKVLETQFKDLKDFGKNLLGFGQYVFSQTKELINPSSNSLIGNIAKTVHRQNSNLTNQSNQGLKADQFSDRVQYFNSEVKEGRHDRFKTVNTGSSSTIGNVTVPSTSNTTNGNLNSNINEVSDINKYKATNQFIELNNNLNNSYAIPNIPSDFRGDFNQIQNLQNQMMNGYQDLALGKGGVDLPYFNLGDRYEVSRQNATIGIIDMSGGESVYQTIYLTDNFGEETSISLNTGTCDGPMCNQMKHFDPFDSTSISIDNLHNISGGGLKW